MVSLESFWPLRWQEEHRMESIFQVEGEAVLVAVVSWLQDQGETLLAPCIEEKTDKHIVTSGQMSSFVEELKPNEYDTLLHYQRQLKNRASGDPPVTISRNMIKVIKIFHNKWAYMLQDVTGFLIIVCKCL